MGYYATCGSWQGEAMIHHGSALRLVLAGLLGGLAVPAQGAQAPDPACEAQTDLPDQPPPDDHLYFVTTRQPDCRTSPVRFKTGRADPTFGYLQTSRLRPVLQSQTAWLNGLRAELASSGGRMLIYIHGYFNSFEDATSRAQLIRSRTGFTGPVLVFSWPSVACVLRPTCYTEDEENALWTQPEFDRVLNVLLAEPAVTDLALIAHSMGNRVLLRGLAEADRSPAAMSRQKVRTIVLAAPDVDRAIAGRDYVPVLDQPGRRTTVYASRTDPALRASWKVHGYPRAGDAACSLSEIIPGRRCLFIARGGVDVVDTSPVRSPLGHADFIESRAAAMDLCRVLAGQAAVGREPIAGQVNAFFLTDRATASDPCP
jgi:esterase/lipase superfamily enzyme